MKNTDLRIDDYIEKSQDFAKPILHHLRKLIHKGNPEVVETIKWGMPAFDYKGPFCGMAAFKNHAVFLFWKSSLIKDPKKYLQDRSNQGGEAMGNLGRITSKKDLPPDSVILDFIKQAKKLNDDGIKIPAKAKPSKKEVEVPDYFLKELKRDKKALSVFENFSTSNKREYVDWITGAKTEKTRDERIQTAIEWIGEGKIRNWKYVRK